MTKNRNLNLSLLDCLQYKRMNVKVHALLLYAKVKLTKSVSSLCLSCIFFASACCWCYAVIIK